MRAAWLVVLLLAPVALAQAPTVDLMTLAVEPFEDLVRPLQGPITTTLEARASCALADPVVGVPFTYVVSEQPAWASIVLSPSTDVRPAETCDAGWVRSTATLTLTATDQAPAFTPARVGVTVRAGGQGREQSREASVNVSATYFSIVDVQLAESMAIVAPGGSKEFTLRATNFGNGATRTELVLARAPPTLDVTLPPPVVLGAQQTGDTRTTALLVVRATAPPEEGAVNRVETIEVRVRSAYAADDSFKGDESTVTMLVTIRQGPEASQRLSAVPAPLALVPLALAALLLARRRA